MYNIIYITIINPDRFKFEFAQNSEQDVKYPACMYIFVLLGGAERVKCKIIYRVKEIWQEFIEKRNGRHILNYQH